MRFFMRTLLLAGVLISVVGLAACGSADTGVKRGYIAISCDGKLVAHADLSQPPTPAPASVSFGTSQYIGGEHNGLFVFTASDGMLRWCTRFSLNKITSCQAPAACLGPPSADVGTPLIAGDVVYVCVTGGPIGVTYAFNASDGALRWSRETGCRMSDHPFDDGAQPILADGVLYSGPYGLSPQDGSIRWRLPSAVAQATIGAVADGMAYVFVGRTLSAVRLADGAVRWSATLDGPIGDRPVLSDGQIYVGTSADASPSATTRGLPNAYALDLHTGAVRWRAPIGGVAGSSAVEADGTVYLGTQDGLNALDAATGTLSWRVALADTSVAASTPVVANGLAYFVGDGAYAVDAATGAVRWHNALDQRHALTFVGPALRDCLLYIGGMDVSGHGTFFALDPATGARRWGNPGFSHLSPPVV